MSAKFNFRSESLSDIPVDGLLGQVLLQPLLVLGVGGALLPGGSIQLNNNMFSTVVFTEEFYELLCFSFTLPSPRGKSEE